MKFGLTVPSYTWPGLDRKMARLVTKDMAKRAEALGYDSITVWDHLLSAPGLYGGSWMDPLMVLSCVAGATETIPLGTHILVVPLRHPVLLAKELATLDHMSEGRFIFGVGPGWNEPEFTAMGISMRERGRRTDEVLDAVKLLLTEENVSFQGQFWQFEDVTIEPRPEKYFPVWVAGGSRIPDSPLAGQALHGVKTVMNRIAKHADVFTVRASGKLEWVVRDIQTMRDYLPTRGRDPSTLGIAHVQAGYVVDTDDTEKALSLQRGPDGDHHGHQPLVGAPPGLLPARQRRRHRRQASHAGGGGHRARDHPARGAGHGAGRAVHGPDHPAALSLSPKYSRTGASPLPFSE